MKKQILRHKDLKKISCMFSEKIDDRRNLDKVLSEVFFDYSDRICDISKTYDTICNLHFPLSFSDVAYKRGISNSMDTISLINSLRVMKFFYSRIWIHIFSRHPFIKITSQYRNSEVNKAVGGSSSSLHLRGLALDISATKETLREIFNLLSVYFLEDKFIIGELMPFELIGYYDTVDFYGIPELKYIHIGFKYYIPSDTFDDLFV